MDIYSLIFISGYFISLLSLTKSGKNLSKPVISIVLIMLFVLSGLRSMNVGYDNIGHQLIFNNISQGVLSFSDFKDPGYALLNLIVSFIGGYELFIIIISSAMLYLLKKSINLFSVYPLISYYMYYSLYFLGNNMAKLRQGIAVLILLWSLGFLSKEENKKFILSVLSASAFHGSAIFFSVLILLNKIKLNRNRMIFIVFVSLLLGTSGLIKFLFEIFIGLGYDVKLFGFERIYSYIESTHMIREGGYFGLFYTLINVFILIFFYKKTLSSRIKEEIVLSKVFFWGSILSILLFNLPLINQRVSMAFLATQIFIIPNLFRYINNKYLRFIFASGYLLMVFLYGYTFFLNNKGYFSPFVFFWN